MKGQKKIFIIIFCFAVAVIGLYMQFIHRPKVDDTGTDMMTETETSTASAIEKKEAEETTERYEYDYADKELPDVDNETASETYNPYDTDAVNVYFTNTDMLDQCSMPMAAQTEMPQDVQNYLIMQGYTDVTELIVDDNEFIDDDDKVLFECAMPGYSDKLQITYDKAKSTLYFAIILDDGTEG